MDHILQEMKNTLAVFSHRRRRLSLVGDAMIYVNYPQTKSSKRQDVYTIQ